MKRNNFFVSLLVCLGLMTAVSSCNKEDKPTVCASNVVICEDAFANTLDVRGAVSNVRIEGNNLKFTIKANGCDGKSWVAKVVSDGSVLYPLPSEKQATRKLRILFENFENCSTEISKEFSFNIKCLRVSDTKEVSLDILGTEYKLLYKY